MLHELLESLLSSLLRTNGLEALATSASRDGLDLGTGRTIDVLDNLVQGTLQLVARLHVLGLEEEGLDMAARQGDRGDRRFSGGGSNARGGRGNRGGAVGRSGGMAVRLVAVDVPLGNGLGGLGLGAAELGEQLPRLGVQRLGGGGGCLLLLSGCLVGRGRSVGGEVRLQVLVDDILDGDVVALSGLRMLLLELLGDRQVVGRGSHGV